MKHNDVTVITNETLSSEAMVATKEGLHGGFATLRFPANLRPSPFSSFEYFALKYSLHARLDHVADCRPCSSGELNLGFQVDRLGGAEEFTHSLICESFSPIAST